PKLASAGVTPRSPGQRAPPPARRDHAGERAEATARERAENGDHDEERPTHRRQTSRPAPRSGVDEERLEPERQPGPAAVRERPASGDRRPGGDPAVADEEECRRVEVEMAVGAAAAEGLDGGGPAEDPDGEAIAAAQVE